MSSEGRHDTVIDAVVITHYHIDHIAALPYFTNKCGYDGPVFMSAPTKSIANLVLQDFSRITTSSSPVSIGQSRYV